MKKIFSFFILLIFLLASCSNNMSAKDPPSNVKEFRLKITHTGGYDPNTFTVNKGDTVRFLATSEPTFHEHGVTILDYGISVKITAGEKDTPQVIEFVADKAGEFLIWCGTCLTGPLGDHYWMRGKLIVK